ncbi:DUF2189 domain-containing protein [Ramlibacter pallidus]|uniref:DUF2189 domain-containing protein n=1 Tax=Ramlibacter pallidus TaxID=2780087 RepID=A0ABR9S4G5_9BURK|nr:DUF2189 domain-containing protein [Ramlibacter pallidus]MBE7368390.1 DUF2189 domain-containing protein [Ramlibacter pallidus]
MTLSSTEPAAPTAAPPRPVVRRLHPSAPLRWLARGARDLRAAPGIALFYGVCFWAMAIALAAVFRHKPEYTMTIISGCLLVGPFLAMGLYEASRRAEQGEPASLGASLTCWDRRLGSMGLLVLVLTVLELLWGRASLVVFAVFFDTGMPSTAGVLEAVFNPRNWKFVAVYLAVGGIFAALVFCTTVVSVPMILDRDTDAVTAGLTSFRVVLDNLPVMVAWGLVVAGLTLLALWPGSLGLLFVGPWLGHATWHAYRDAVAWPEPAAA